MKTSGQFIQVIVLLSAFWPAISPGQSNDAAGYIPPSPNAQTFLKYGDYPVDYSTGVPSINIPLYTIAVKNYSFPVSASFHASGRMASLNFSQLGLNWALQASGLISREIKGVPDERAAHLEKLPAYYTTQGAHLQELFDLEHGYLKDPEYDIFSIDVNGISVKFIVRDDRSILFLTYCPYKLSITSNDGHSFNAFTLVDDKGVIYQFGADATGFGFSEFSASVGTTSWFLSSITSPTGGKIRFKYAAQSTTAGNPTFIGTYNYTERLTIADLPSAQLTTTDVSLVPPGDYKTASVAHRSNSNGRTDFTMAYITEIDFDNGKMLFTYNPSNLLLQGCQVISSFDNSIIKSVGFVYTTIPGSSNVLLNNNTVTIQQIQFKGSNSVVAEKYNFDYYAGTTMDQVAFGKAKDYWGYCNGRTADGPAYIPVPTIAIITADPVPAPDINVGCTYCRLPSFTAKVVGMIRRIYYPTGGNTEFIYESNFYNDIYSTPSVKEGPGIRIKQILSSDNFGNKTAKTYKYGVNEDGIGQLVWIPREADYVTVTMRNFNHWSSSNGPVYPQDYAYYRFRVYSSEPVPEVQKAMRLPVYYPQVTEYNSVETEPAVNGKTVYTYNSPSASKPYVSVESSVPFYLQNFNFDVWSTSNLSAKSIYRYDAAKNEYKLLSNTDYTYQKLNAVTIPQASCYRFLEFPGEQPGLVAGKMTELVTKTPPSSGFNNWRVYYLCDKSINAAVLKPVGETETQYDAAGTAMISTTTYKYNNLAHVHPTSTQTTTSEQKQVTTYTNYAQDYPAGTAFLDDLKAKNLVLPVENVITQSDGINTSILSGEITTYKTGGAGLAAELFKTEIDRPINLTSFKFSNRAIGLLPAAGAATAFLKDNVYKKRVAFDLYDARSNALQVTPVGDVPVSYQWGYNNSYPVVQAKNAAYKNIFYTSFEETDGNNTASSKTGRFSRTGGYSKTISGIDNGPYTLSYWSFSGGSWTLQSSRITVSTNVYTINIPGQVDEVRFYPVNAQMSTYTYEPLVGLTSSTDINNIPTYFEYDFFNRLKVVKDQQLNISKRYDYGVVNPSYFNDAQTSTFNRSDCSAEFLGSTISYTVPKGSYSSAISLADANAKALADILAKGQAYANKNGYCFNFKNTELSKVFIKACSAGLYGSEIAYVVPAGKYTSIISQADVQQKAGSDVDANGQLWVNTQGGGKCYTYAEAFKNEAIRVTLQKNNCPFGFSGSLYPSNPFVIPYGKYISTVSLDAANNKARSELNAKQDEVNNQGYCTANATVTIQVSNSTHYDVVIGFSNAAGYYSYVAAKDNFNGTVTIPSVVYNSVTMNPTPSNSNIFHFSLGGVMQQGSSGSFSNVQPGAISITN